MAIYIAAQALFDGIDSVPFLWPLLKTAPWLLLLWLLKTFFQGARNTSERNMHGKVILVTGGTSGVGEATVRALASRGAQVVLLTQHALADPFIVDFIQDLRDDTDNPLITAEQVDLSSLHSIRTFATRWIDNAPPRRLDMVVLCATAITAPGTRAVPSTSEGVELNWQLNYLANFHLLSILSPALRAQPPDRDVRVVFGTCSSYMGGDLQHITRGGGQSMGKDSADGKINPGDNSAEGKSTPGKSTPGKSTPGKSNSANSTSARAASTPSKFSPGNAYATSKLALTTFALAFQKHLAAYQRPDKSPNNAKVLLVDPGLCRTPGTRTWLTRGSLFGLLLYLFTYPFWLLLLKSPDSGSQSFLFACMEEKFARAEGCILIKEVKERAFLRKDVEDEEVQRKLWQYSEQMVQEAEKRGAEFRAKRKQEEQDTKDEQDAAKQMRDYKEKVGKKDGKMEGNRKSKRVG